MRDISTIVTNDKTMSIVDAMKKIDANALGILFIVDSENKIVASLTDGDIRRWIIRGGRLDAPISVAMNKNPKSICDVDVTHAYEIMDNMKLHVLPVVDEQGVVVDIISDRGENIDRSIGNSLRNVPVVIMAGGKGTRLYPYTKVLPKPLIPIGETPIVEIILNRFNSFGINDYYMTVNYKSGMIKAFFSELAPDYNIEFVDEETPLGTAGSIKYLQNKIISPFFVSNCDILIDADYEKMYKYHVESNNMITVVAALKNIYVPYGVVELNNEGRIEKIKEKPRLSYMVNTGMYILNPEAVDYIPEDTVYHMTDLIEDLINKGIKVGMFPLGEDSFLDMGEFEEMQKMEEKLKNSEV